MNSLLGSTAELAILLKLKDEVSGPLNNIDRSLSGLNTKTATVSGGLGKIGSGLALGAERVAVGLVAAGGAVAAIAVSATDAAATYQSAMELIHTQAGASQAEVTSMSAALLNLAPQVGTSADDLAAGLYHIESAGVRGTQALQELTIAAEGAKVGQANLEDVTNALVGAVNTGIGGTQNLSLAMGTLNGIVGSGNMRMADLTDAIATGILPTAKSMGLTLTDVGAALADMTDQGVPAADAATRLRMTFSLMEAPTSKATKALASIGMTSTSMANDMRQPNGLLVALTDLKTHLDDSGASAVQQSQIISAAFGGGRTSSTILTLLGSLDRLNTKYQDITSSTNDFANAWDSTALTIDQRKAALGAGIDALKIKLGDELLPVEGKVLDALTKLASDPAVSAGIASLGDGLASMFTDQNIANAESFVSGVIPGLLSFANDVLPPLEQGLQITGAAAKEAFDMFMALPEPVKAAVIAAIAANKLTGGLVASGLGDLAKVAMGQGAGAVSGGGLGIGVQHVWVDNMGMGMGAGAGAAAGEAASAGAVGSDFAATFAGGAGSVSLAAALAPLIPMIAIGAIPYMAGVKLGVPDAGTNPMFSQGNVNPITGEQYGYGANAIPKSWTATDPLPIFDVTKTVAPLSHDTGAVDAANLAIAAHSLDGAVSAWRDSTSSLNTVSAAISHDTTGSDMHAAAQSLDSAVRAWRDSPPINVQVNTVVSIRDINNANVHSTANHTAVPI